MKLNISRGGLNAKFKLRENRKILLCRALIIASRRSTILKVGIFQPCELIIYTCPLFAACLSLWLKTRKLRRMGERFKIAKFILACMTSTLMGKTFAGIKFRGFTLNRESFSPLKIWIHSIAKFYHLVENHEIRKVSRILPTAKVCPIKVLAYVNASILLSSSTEMKWYYIPYSSI